MPFKDKIAVFRTTKAVVSGEMEILLRRKLDPELVRDVVLITPVGSDHKTLMPNIGASYEFAGLRCYGIVHVRPNLLEIPGGPGTFTCAPRA